MPAQQRLSNHLAGLWVDGGVSVCQSGAQKFVRVQLATAIRVTDHQGFGSLHCTLCPTIGLGIVGAGDSHLHSPALEPILHLLRGEVLPSIASKLFWHAHVSELVSQG